MNLRINPISELVPEMHWIYASSSTQIFLQCSGDFILDLNICITLKQVLSCYLEVADLPI